MPLFKRSTATKSVSPDAIVENPYISARREWNERYGSFIFWMKVGLGFGAAGLLVAIIAAGGLVHVAGQSKFVPVYVLVDKLGDHLTVGRADNAKITPDQVVKAQLGAWLIDVRSVTPDKVVQLKNVRSAYAMVQDGDAAKTKLDRWYGGEGKEKTNVTESNADPFARAASETVEVQLRGAPLPISPESWQADWIEIVRDRKGKETNRFQMRVVWTVKQLPAMNEEQVMANPTGSYVSDFSWSRQY
jgi:type IV secretion system protein VirB5